MEEYVFVRKWQPIATAPLENAELELHIDNKDIDHTLTFPCRRDGKGWRACAYDTYLELQPTHWRLWDHKHDVGSADIHDDGSDHIGSQRHSCFMPCRALPHHSSSVTLRRVGLDAADFSGHSLRSGFLTSAARRGASLFKMMDVSRHRSVDTLRGYVRDARAFP